MSKLSLYYSKLSELKNLQNEVDQLAESDELKSELEFKEKLESLMDEYDQSAKSVARILSELDPSLKLNGKTAAQATSGPKRPLVTYQNPHTKEIVKTRGGNQKTLKQWRNEYGADVVNGWKIDG